MHGATDPLPFSIATVYAEELTAILLVRVAPVINQVCISCFLAHRSPFFLCDTCEAYPVVKLRLVFPAHFSLEELGTAGEDLVATIAVAKFVFWKPAVSEADEKGRHLRGGEAVAITLMIAEPVCRCYLQRR